MRPTLNPRAALVVVVVFGAAACADDAPSFVEPDAAIVDAASEAGGPLSLGRLLRAWPREPCTAGPYREFDFWIGEWNVFNPSGTQVGTDRIESILDGCVVAEHWVAGNGLAGRSINTYDRDTGIWHQTWVSANPIGHIRMAGGLDGGTMIMDGVREAPTFSIVDHYEWEEVEPGVVLQSGVRDIVGPDLHFPFALTYRPAPDFQPATPVETALCQEGGPSEASRLADFLLGTWQVTKRNGRRAIGTVEITSDLSGCLFDERFATRKGLRSIAFLYYDHVEQAWYRTLIDSEGERVELRGSLTDDVLTLEGREPGPHRRRVDVRLTWEKETANRIRHRIEIAKTHGRWRTELELLWRRQ